MATLKEYWEEYNDGETVNYTPGDLGLDDLGYVDMADYRISEDGTTAEITLSCSEPMDFHRNCSPEYFDEDGTLTNAAWVALQRVFAGRYSADIYEQDEYLRFTVDIQAPASADESTLGDILWPTVAKLANELDPGTFGSEYLFGTILSDAMAA
jgi:hypothetical protein